MTQHEAEAVINGVAAAICEADNHTWDELTKTYNGRMQQRQYVRMAEAAIAAMPFRRVVHQPLVRIDVDAIHRKIGG